MMRELGDGLVVLMFVLVVMAGVGLIVIGIVFAIVSIKEWWDWKHDNTLEQRADKVLEDPDEESD